MKKNILFFLFILSSVNLFGQIWLENFDGSNVTNPISTSLQCNDNGGVSYFGIMCGFGVGCGNEISMENTDSYTSLPDQFLGGRIAIAHLSLLFLRL